MKYKRWYIAIVLASAANGQYLGSKLWEEFHPTAAFVVTLMPEHDFRVDALAQACIATANAADLDYFEWIALTNSAQAMYIRQPLVENPTFQRWQRLYSAAARMPWKAARCVQTRRGTVLMLRQDDEVSERVLNGSNPLELESMAGKFTILRISLRASAVISVFAKSEGEPNEAAARELFRHIEKMFPKSSIETLVRRDPWFSLHPGYFLYNPFVIDRTPPEYAVWRQLPFSRCSNVNDQVHCTAYAGEN